MQVTDLDGNQSYIRLKNNTNHTLRSSYHLSARTLLYEIFSTSIIIEEITIRIGKGQVLYLDFYIPLYRMAVEIHGEQHYSFNSFFHKSQIDFFKQQRHDNNKREWCSINDITLIELKFNKQDGWKSKILEGLEHKNVRNIGKTEP